jgi:hypothetical protein
VGPNEGVAVALIAIAVEGSAAAAFEDACVVGGAAAFAVAGGAGRVGYLDLRVGGAVVFAASDPHIAPKAFEAKLISG